MNEIKRTSKKERYQPQIWITNNDMCPITCWATEPQLGWWDYRKGTVVLWPLRHGLRQSMAIATVTGKISTAIREPFRFRASCGFVCLHNGVWTLDDRPRRSIRETTNDSRKKKEGKKERKKGKERNYCFLLLNDPKRHQKSPRASHLHSPRGRRGDRLQWMWPMGMYSVVFFHQSSFVQFTASVMSSTNHIAECRAALVHGNGWGHWIKSVSIKCLSRQTWHNSQISSWDTDSQ